MIEYIKIGYQFDPVYAVFHKSRSQDDITLSGQFPDTIRIERNQKLHISSELVLTYLSGIKWLLITGLTPVEIKSGHYVGNRVLTGPGSKKKTAMIVMCNDVMKGKMTVFLFPDYDARNNADRHKAAKDFIKSVCKNVGQV